MMMQLVSLLFQPVVAAVGDPFYKITSEALLVCQQLVIVIRPLGLYLSQPRRPHLIYTDILATTPCSKKSGPFVISSYVSFNKDTVHENSKKCADVVRCEYGLSVYENKINYFLPNHQNEKAAKYQVNTFKTRSFYITTKIIIRSRNCLHLTTNVQNARSLLRYKH